MNLENIVLDEISRIDNKLEYLFLEFQDGSLSNSEYHSEAQRWVEVKRPLERVLMKYKPEVYGEKK